MIRRFTLVVAVLTFAVPAAQAKAPPNGATFCGAAGVCVPLTYQESETLQIWHVGGTERAPGAPAPYYALRVRWQAAGQEEMFYWIPSRGLVRMQFGWGGVGWFRVPSHQTLPLSVVGVAPIAMPRVTAATVGGRRVQSPATYLQLLSAGRQVSINPIVDWLRVRFVTSTPSPFTDAHTDVRIAKDGAYVLRDRFVFKIPARLADRARRGLSLSG
jgi:hypothetical protein